MNKKQRKQKLQRTQQHSTQSKIEAKKTKAKIALYQNDVARIFCGLPLNSSDEVIQAELDLRQKQLDKLKARGLSPLLHKLTWFQAFFLKLASQWKYAKT